MDLELWIPVVSTLVTGGVAVWVAKINHDNKPIKDVLKRTKLEGDGSLVEAMGVLSREYQESQTRHTKEIKYFVAQLAIARDEIYALQSALHDKEAEIMILEEKVSRCEAEIGIKE